MTFHKTIKICFLICILLSFEVVADYKFEPPDFSEHSNGQVFHYFLPADSGFAGNVNLMIQPFSGSLDDYNELTQQQFKSIGFQVIKTKILKSEIIYEYKGFSSGLDLYWFSRAIKQGDKIYLVTATALQKRWEIEKAILIKSTMSFKL